MVSTLEWVLLGIGVYWLGVLWLRRNGLLPEYLGTQGPILTIHTRRFRSLLDRAAGPGRFWRAWGNFGVGVALVVMAGSFVLLAFLALSELRNPTRPSAINQPRNVLVIPGINDFLPLSVAPEILAGLLIGLVVHEGGHGLMCRVGDIEIESMGIALFTIVPIGAFVEPDDGSRRRASRGAQTRMFAAGVMNNFVVTLLAFGLLFGPVMGAVAVADGAAVGGSLPGSAADDAGIGQGDRILAVNDRRIGTNDDLDDVLSEIDDRVVEVRVDDGSGVHTTTVRRSLLVTEVTAGTPFADAIDIRTTVAAVNGTPVYTESEFRELVRARRVATLRTAGDETVTGPIGAAVTVLPNGPTAESGIDPGTNGVVTAIDGTRVTSASDLDDALDGTREGQTVTIELYVDGERRVRDVALGAHPRDDHGFLGVGVAPGTSGLGINDFGTRLYPAGLYLSLLGGGDGGGPSFFGRILLSLQLPLASLAGFPFNFAGFTGGIANFYTVEGPLGAAGGALFVFANVLFWTGWINLNLGVFNCIPAFPLDGGHILRTSTEAIVSRLPIERRRDLTTAVTTSVGLLMLASLLVTLFGPRLLS